jgi:CRP-like cAMP-binding protein
MKEILKKIPFFAQLGEEDLLAIVENVTMDYFQAGHTIFKEGEAGDKMYVIKSGQVEVLRNGAQINTLKENSFFGEMALVSDEPRNATVKALSDVEALILKKDDFKKLLASSPSIASMVSYEVVKRINK